MTAAARGAVPHHFLYACFGMCLGPPPPPPPKTPTPGLPAKKPPESKGSVESRSARAPFCTRYLRTAFHHAVAHTCNRVATWGGLGKGAEEDGLGRAGYEPGGTLPYTTCYAESNSPILTYF